MRVLITGITGFVGSHLADYCLGRGDVEVFGTVRWRSRMENVKDIANDIEMLDCDLRDAAAVRHCLSEVKPDYIFHLAAQSFVPTSWKAPSETIITNIVGQLNIFEAMRDLDLPARIQIAGSSEEYGMVHEDEVPIKETNPLRPLSPYGVSKVGQDLLGYQYHMSYGLKIIRTRAFNHTGPRRGDVFVTSNFCKQVAKIEKGKQEPVLEVGNLEARRDFTDVRDMVYGYWLALEKGEPGDVYNLGSGKDITIQRLLDMLLELTSVEIEVRQDPERMRPSDVMVLLADITKFSDLTGWKPEIPFEKTLEDTLEYWRERV
ncbi:MAG: GDP-mannose 4,6-dehydratase [Actinobacteria bacterium]|nr:GDP-mannose 4,6-dehydratase [Actinomycetota bacterium]MCG2819809.1 GDP-mannose 4,6-dehydratase [Actinomycetes bacterium]MBU4217767.1 GDP-mannose 4,6-dehydratase [Actinomycetota bacterium]MBU4357998.1 GDP-mannose 4,6-dehydratase [Actinomycetota bacterium]MBU4391818.1 GDP-mannose 4,6-dehydratase [Actinomycetota bacterium]